MPGASRVHFRGLFAFLDIFDQYNFSKAIFGPFSGSDQNSKIHYIVYMRVSDTKKHFVNIPNGSHAFYKR